MTNDELKIDKTKYRIYIDETGNSDIGNSSNPNHRFLTLTGVIIDLSYVDQTVFPELEDLKKCYFDSHPDDPVTMHRKDMINCNGRFSVLSDKKINEQFSFELLMLLNKWEYLVISVILDKLDLIQRYTVWQWDPYHYCLMIIIERYVSFLESAGAVGDVMAESRGAKEDNRLKDSFLNLYNNGSDYISTERFQKVLTSKQLKVKNKTNNIAGLQLSDLLAHPSRLHMLKTFDLREEDYSEKFAGRVIDILKQKYLKMGNKSKGWGIKKLP